MSHKHRRMKHRERKELERMMQEPSLPAEPPPPQIVPVPAPYGLFQSVQSQDLQYQSWFNEWQILQEVRKRGV